MVRLRLSQVPSDVKSKQGHLALEEALEALLMELFLQLSLGGQQRTRIAAWEVLIVLAERARTVAEASDRAAMEHVEDAAVLAALVSGV
mmetsp:Transcript_1596/g.3289  ORF Transcript_1596/g.3289 Transcript_1596/m.3289 type:complete len:89 (+) Transcript_1596:489-755(+)